MNSFHILHHRTDFFVSFSLSRTLVFADEKPPNEFIQNKQSIGLQTECYHFVGLINVVNVITYMILCTSYNERLSGLPVLCFASHAHIQTHA